MGLEEMTHNQDLQRRHAELKSQLTKYLDSDYESPAVGKHYVQALALHREPAKCGCICVHCHADDHPTCCKCACRCRRLDGWHYASCRLLTSASLEHKVDGVDSVYKNKER